MPRWGQGAADVERLLSARHLQKVATSTESVELLLSAAARHVELARAGVLLDLDGAYSLAYDAARKCATALLGHQGLRPTTAGGHLAVVEAARAQFPGVPGLTALDRLRRRRHQAEYPDPEAHDPITADEVDDAVRVAQECLTSARRLLDREELGLF